MLRWLTRGFAARMGAFLAALALAAFVAPPVAVAFAPTPAAIYCLTHVDHEADDNYGTVPAGVSHSVHHVKHSGDKPAHKSNCCGMFSVSALAPEAAPAILRPWSDSAVSMFVEPDFQTRVPELPVRPPISRL